MSDHSKTVTTDSRYLPPDVLLDEPDPNEPKRAKRNWAKWILIAGIWLIPALLSGGQLYLRMKSLGMPVSFWQTFLGQLLTWYLWAAVTPLLFWLGRRFRIDREKWWRGVLAHLPFSGIIVLLYFVVWVLIYMAVQPGTFGLSNFSGLYRQALSASLFVNYLVYWILIGVGYALEYYSRLRERELHASKLEAQLAQAQIHALKMQLHPHFLFNTLNAISVLVRKNDNKSATQMLSGLSDLFRYALDNTGKQLVTLNEELDFIERYLEIERIRFEDRLRVKINVAPDSLGALVPNLVLQPLVENAIRHGIAKRAAAGLVQIEAKRNNGRLCITISDDGPGLAQAAIPPAEMGLGLKNTIARLKQLYGSAYTLEFATAGTGGCLVTLTVPYRRNTDSQVEVTLE